MSKVVRVIVGVVSGYAAMVLLITLVQEVWFGGVGWHQSSTGVLLIGAALLGAELFMSYRQRTKPGVAMHRET